MNEVGGVRTSGDVVHGQSARKTDARAPERYRVPWWEEAERDARLGADR